MRIIFGLILIILGISVFVQIPIFNFLIALFIIVIGLRLLSGHPRRDRYHRNKEKFRERFENNFSEGTSHDLDEVRVFGGLKRKVVMDDFENGRVISIFAGSEVDMSSVKTSEKTVYLELVAVFGGIRIKIPKNWKVINKSTTVAGRIDDNTSGTGSVVVKINGATVLGGIEIFN